VLHLCALLAAVFFAHADTFYFPFCLLPSFAFVLQLMYVAGGLHTLTQCAV
jgi:hypothetical protein